MDDITSARLRESRDWLRGQLDICADFWLDRGMDRKHGGVYTCLDRQGRIYSTDKSVWMQGRCAWTYSYLCHVYGQRPEWLEAAKSCLDFLEDRCVNRAAATASTSRSPKRAPPASAPLQLL